MADTHDTPNQTAPEETQDQPQPGVKAKAKALFQNKRVAAAVATIAIMLLLMFCGESGESQDSTTIATPEAGKSSEVSSGKQQEPLLVKGIVRIVNVKGEVVVEITMNSAKLHELSNSGEIVSRPSQKWNTDLKQAPNGQRRLHQAILNTICPNKADHPQLKAFELCN